MQRLNNQVFLSVFSQNLFCMEGKYFNLSNSHQKFSICVFCLIISIPWRPSQKKNKSQNWSKNIYRISFLLSLIFSNQTWKILTGNFSEILGQTEIWGACCQHIFSKVFAFSKPQWQAVNSFLERGGRRGRCKKRERKEKERRKLSWMFRFLPWTLADSSQLAFGDMVVW